MSTSRQQRYNPTMSRKHLIAGITATLNKLPRNAHIAVEVRSGVERRASEDGMSMDIEHNGSMTITIRVNGGAQDTEGSPKYLDRFPELKAAVSRLNPPPAGGAGSPRRRYRTPRAAGKR